MHIHVDSPYQQCILFLLNPGTLQDTDPRPTLKFTLSVLPYPKIKKGPNLTDIPDASNKLDSKECLETSKKGTQRLCHS